MSMPCLHGMGIYTTYRDRQGGRCDCETTRRHGKDGGSEHESHGNHLHGDTIVAFWNRCTGALPGGAANRRTTPAPGRAEQAKVEGATTTAGRASATFEPGNEPATANQATAAEIERRPATAAGDARSGCSATATITKQA